MRSVIQRVTKAKVIVGEECVGKIDKGMVVLLGVGAEDTTQDLDYMVEKVSGLRIFDDEDGKMNLSVQDIKGGVLVVSQFTLYGDCRKGKRPSWSDAAKPDKAEQLYNRFIDEIRKKGIPVECGIFQAEMSVDLKNDGPVTLLIDSKKVF